MWRTDRPRDLLAVAGLSGLAAGSGQVPFSMLPVALAGLVVAAALVFRARSARMAGLIGFVAGTAYFATVLHWIVEPFLVDIPRHGWMAPFALVFISTGFGLFWAAAFWAARRVAAGGWRLALALGAAWGAAELLRSVVLTGFSWGLIGYVWTETPAAQIAAVTGPYGLSVLTALGAAFVTLIGRRWIALASGLVAFWGGPILLGQALMPPEDIAGADAPVIRLVQPNAAQHEKWDPDKVPGFFARQLDYTAAAPGSLGTPAMTVWPETAIPWRLEAGQPALARIADAADGRPVIVGAQRVEGLRAYNSLAVLRPDGGIAQRYDKHHLVPFGEFIPLGGLAEHFGIPSFAARDGYGYSPGPGPKLLELGPLGRALPLICYEAIFPRNLRGTDRSDWLVQITNDAWFGTFSGPQQHLAQARMRAIEQGLPMVRVANTGISAMIDAAGRIVTEIPLGEAGYADARLPAARPPTPYAVAGEMPVALFLILAGVAVTLTRKREKP